VTIYFTESVTARIVDRFYNALVDGGWMVVGHSEHSLTTYRRFQARNFPNAILYQRTLDKQDPFRSSSQPAELTSDTDWLTSFAAQASEVKTPTSAQQIPTEQVPRHPLPTAQDLQPVASEPITDGSDQAPARSVPTPGKDLQSVTPELQESEHLERARDLLDQGQSESARDLLLQLVESGGLSDADHTIIYTSLGRAHANLGLWDEAEHWCRMALDQDKLALEAYYTLALVLQHQGQLDQAINAMKKVVYIERNNVLGHFGLADLYRNNGQLSHALKSLDNVRRLLESRPADELLPNSGGITVARLRETVIRQQQQWSADAMNQNTHRADSSQAHPKQRDERG
jgi:chemotaxis protein methyltransferase CheR